MKQWIVKPFKGIGSWLGGLFQADPETGKRKLPLKWMILLVAVIFLVFFSVAWYWGREPDLFDVRQKAQAKAGTETPVSGYVTTATLIAVAEKMLDKPGGYLSNDIAPPSVFMDNIPNWEFGALVQIRDLAHSLRYDFSRSRTQSEENAFLREAEPLFSYHNDSWALPSSESQYRKGVRGLERYLAQLSAQEHADSQFYTRADNLRDWLAMVEKQLGSLSQRLSASVGQTRINTDLAGDAAARQSTTTPEVVVVKTPWLKLDDVFYEARGATWALHHFLRAVEIDFEDVLKNKNAQALLRQIIRELDYTQRSVWSPMILNGKGFGFFANHSLVLASYISRANAALIDLRDLLSQG